MNSSGMSSRNDPSSNNPTTTTMSTTTSPRHVQHQNSAGGNTTTQHYRLGQSLVQARLSISPRRSSLTPTNSTTTTTAATTTTRFSFGGVASNSSSGGPASHHHHHKQQQQHHHHTTQKPPLVMLQVNDNNNDNDNDKTKDNDNDNTVVEMMDGMDIGQLRQLAQHACCETSGSGGSGALTFCRLLYSKTHLPPDALLLAQALWKTHTTTTTNTTTPPQYPAKRVVRLLEEAGFFSSTNYSHHTAHVSKKERIPPLLRLDALLLACQAWSQLQEWSHLLALVEDAQFYALLLLQPEEEEEQDGVNPLWGSSSTTDQDDITLWQGLSERLGLSTNGSNASIHPLARLLHFRGKAYLETGHAHRASTFFQLALSLDPKCIEAWESLWTQPPSSQGNGNASQTPLLTLAQASAFLAELQHAPSATDVPTWLWDLYLAKIQMGGPTTSSVMVGPTISTTTTTTTAAPNANVNTTTGTGTSFLKEDHPNDDDDDDKTKTVLGGSGGGGEPSSTSFWQDAPSAMQWMTPIEKSTITHDNDNDNGNSTHHHDDDALHRLLYHYKLDEAPDVLAMAAQRAYAQGNLKQALEYCQQLDRLDSLASPAASVHVATLVALKQTRVLFQLAHAWVDAAPQSSVAWLAVGAYYYVCGRYHVAQRHFCRATRLDPHNVQGWVAFGCAFCAVEESDQALASFRAAQRLAPGDATSLLYIGMEYLRTNHGSLAHHFLNAAYATQPTALNANEWGVYALKVDQAYDTACQWFLQALQGAAAANSSNTSSSSGPTKTRGWNLEETSLESLTRLLEGVKDPYWEPTVSNLAHALRKLRRFDAALVCLERSCTLCPNQASGYSAKGFCLHLAGHLDEAIEAYHQALARKPEDPFASEMLQRALADALDQTTEWLGGVGLTMDHNDEEEPSADTTHVAASANRPPRESMQSMMAMSEASGFSALSVDDTHDSSGDVDMG